MAYKTPKIKLPEGVENLTIEGKSVAPLENGVRGFTLAERDALHEQKLAEARARNKGKAKEKLAISGARKLNAVHYQHKDTSGQLEMLMTQVLKQFIDELKGKPLLTVDYTNKESVSRRREHLTVINSTMTVIRSLRDLKELIADDEKKAEASNVLTPDNVAMMDAAKQMLEVTNTNKRGDTNVILMEDAKEMLANSGIKAVM